MDAELFAIEDFALLVEHVDTGLETVEVSGTGFDGFGLLFVTTARNSLCRYRGRAVRVLGYDVFELLHCC